MIKLYAQLYKSNLGFFFETAEEYDQSIKEVQRALGLMGEGIDIQFMEGEEIDRELFNILKVHQGNVLTYLKAVKNWDEDDKVKVVISVRELGFDFTLGKDRPDQQDMTLYALDSLYDLAIQFVEDGLYGEIPSTIASYVDYEAIARDLRCDYSEFRIARNNYIYCCD